MMSLSKGFATLLASNSLLASCRENPVLNCLECACQCLWILNLQTQIWHWCPTTSSTSRDTSAQLKSTLLKSILQLLPVLQDEFKPVRIEGLISTKALQSSKLPWGSTLTRNLWFAAVSSKLPIVQELRLEQKADLGGSAANTLCEIDSPIPVHEGRMFKVIWIESSTNAFLYRPWAITKQLPSIKVMSSNSLLPMECGILALHRQSLKAQKNVYQLPFQTSVRQSISSRMLWESAAEVQQTFSRVFSERLQCWVTWDSPLWPLCETSEALKPQILTVAWLPSGCSLLSFPNCKVETAVLATWNPTAKRQGMLQRPSKDLLLSACCFFFSIFAISCTLHTILCNSSGWALPNPVVWNASDFSTTNERATCQEISCDRAPPRKLDEKPERMDRWFINVHSNDCDKSFWAVLTSPSATISNFFLKFQLQALPLPMKYSNGLCITWWVCALSVAAILGHTTIFKL